MLGHGLSSFVADEHRESSSTARCNAGNGADFSLAGSIYVRSESSKVLAFSALRSPLAAPYYCNHNYQSSYFS